MSEEDKHYWAAWVGPWLLVTACDLSACAASDLISVKGLKAAAIVAWTEKLAPKCNVGEIYLECCARVCVRSRLGRRRLFVEPNYF